MQKKPQQTHFIKLKLNSPIVNILTASLILISNLAYTNIAHAGHTSDNQSDSPKPGTRSDARTAVSSDNRIFLRQIADDNETYSNGNFTRYTINNMPNKTALWSWGWCTKTYQQLEENWKHINILYTVNGKSIPLKNFVTDEHYRDIEIPGYGEQRSICRSSYGVLSDWPTGSHELSIEAKLNKTIYDGWDTFPADTTYRAEYKVNVRNSANNNIITNQDSPKPGTRSAARTAMGNKTRNLWDIVDDYQQDDTGDKSQTTILTINNMRNNSVLWSWVWCTKTYQQLEENWKHINILYTVNGKRIPLNHFVIDEDYQHIDIPGYGEQRSICRSSYGVLSDWPTGSHELSIEAKFNKAIYDGWDTFPIDTIYRDVYKINVANSAKDKPIGIESLGNTNYKCYIIEGNNSNELAEQMDKQGPSDISDEGEIWAWVTGTYNYDGHMNDLSTLKVNYYPMVTIPCWYPPAGTNARVIDEFNDLMRAIVRHELRHVEISQQYAQILEQRLKNSAPYSKAKWDRIYNETILKERKAAQDEFHQSPAGRPLCYPQGMLCPVLK